MKKVFLYAYDRRNLGDDLFVQTITQRYPDVQFYMWSDKKNRRTYGHLRNLKVIDKDSLVVRVLNRLRPSLVVRYKNAWIKRCDAVVYIGGSIFMEYENWRQICNWWEYEANNRPFYVMGANFGPWHTEAYRQKMAEIFAKCKDVCFRDRYSAGLFEGLETVHCAPDILFAHPMPCAAVKDKQLFVSVIDCAGRDESHGLREYDAGYITNMAALLRGYLDDGYSLVLSSFCAEEGDETGIAKLTQAMGCEHDSRVAVLRYDGTNAEEIKRTIAESELVIGTRFHAVILAMAAGRPVLPIVYSDKTQHVLDDLGFAGAIVDLRSDEPWGRPMVERNSQDVDREREKAVAHFEQLDKVLR